MIWQLICYWLKIHFKCALHCIVMFADDIKLRATRLIAFSWNIDECAASKLLLHHQREILSLFLSTLHIIRIAVFLCHSLTFSFILLSVTLASPRYAFAAYISLCCEMVWHRISFTKCQFIKECSWVKNTFFAFRLVCSNQQPASKPKREAPKLRTTEEKTPKISY